MNMMIRLLIITTASLLGVPQVSYSQHEAGGPPNFPIAREKPRVWEARVRSQLVGASVNGVMTTQSPIQCPRSEIVIPIIMRGTYSRTDPNSISVTAAIGSQWQRAGDVPWTLRGPHPDGSAEIVVEFLDVNTSSITMEANWRTQTWESSLNERAASEIGWPTEWPEAVRTYLEPSLFIESNAPEFTNFVNSITNGRIRTVTPYLAAKELVKQTVLNFRSVVGGSMDTTSLTGAAESLRNGRGSRLDMTCACVATLRAAGIPARPVMGITKLLNKKQVKETTAWTPWAELYLPGAGWIPFDPFEMRGSGFQHRELTAQWRWFGSVKDLVERIPVAYRLSPPGNDLRLRNSAKTSVGVVDIQKNLFETSVWGWVTDGCSQGQSSWNTNLARINRGAGTPDPR
jgi:transglutaminase-like putative cysteine protease